MDFVVLFFERFNEHIININLHNFSELVGKHTVDELLIGCTCILQTERYYFVAIRAAICDECSFLIVGIHHDLIVTRKGIHERHGLVSSRRFD